MRFKIVTLCACLAIGISLATIGQDGEHPQDMSLANVAALQSSGHEAYCDQRDQTSCVIRVGDIVGTSTGSIRGN